jgi:hypothetical protein
MQMERLILFLQSESSGLEIRDRSRRLTTYPACFPGKQRMNACKNFVVGLSRFPYTFSGFLRPSS